MIRKCHTTRRREFSRRIEDVEMRKIPPISRMLIPLPNPLCQKLQALFKWVVSDFFANYVDLFSPQNLFINVGHIFCHIFTSPNFLGPHDWQCAERHGAVAGSPSHSHRDEGICQAAAADIFD